jgi:Reverse transcriptase (RNA-dependent DNA polymerase)
MSETISSTDPRATSPEAAAAKRKEIAGLIARNTWKIVCKQDVRDSANILGGRFILTIKDVNTGNEFFKARYVVQGHKDREKAQLVHNSTTLMQSSTKLILSFAALFRFRVWNQDVTQAYTQSALALMRKIFLQPAKKDLNYFEMTSDEVLQLLRPLYGLADAGDYWNATMVDHMLNDLGLFRTDSDLSLFYNRLNNRLNGISGTCVDDSLHAGSANYLELTEKSQQRFLSRERKFDTFSFNGADIQSNDDGTFSLCQRFYIETLSPLAPTVSFTDFRSHRAKVSWICHTRPAVCYFANNSAQVTERTFSPVNVKSFNAVLENLRKTADHKLDFQHLDINTLRIVAYSDASFANNADLSSQLGFVIFLSDASRKCNVFNYRSYKSRRVTRSVLGGEILAFADAFDCAYTLRKDIEKMLGRKVPLSLLTDSKSLFDIITKSSSTLEKRLMIDVAAARESYANEELSDIGLIRGEHNPADAFTKDSPAARKMLETILTSGSLDHPIVQWIYR